MATQLSVLITVVGHKASQTTTRTCMYIGLCMHRRPEKLLKVIYTIFVGYRNLYLYHIYLESCLWAPLGYCTLKYLAPDQQRSYAVLIRESLELEYILCRSIYKQFHYAETFYVGYPNQCMPVMAGGSFVLGLLGFLPLAAALYTNTSNGLTAIPLNIPPAETEINLNDNNLATVGGSVFSAYTGLVTVRLEENVLINVHRSAFCGAPVRSLYLAQNLLTQIPDVSCLSPSLAYLYLQHNPLVTMDPTHLAGVPLIRLDIRYSLYTSFPDFSAVAPTLKYLMFSASAVENVADGVLDGFVSLAYLDFSMHIGYLPVFGDIAATLDYWNFQNMGLTYLDKVGEVYSIC